MKIGLVQYSPEWESKRSNIEKLNQMIQAKSKDTKLLIFPEMTLTGFTMNSEKYSEEIDGEGFKYFINTARENKINIISGLIEKNETNIYNSSIHFDENGLIAAVYRKIHPFSPAKENEYFSNGKEIVTTSIDHVRIGMSICYDLRFPELYRLYAKQGIDVAVNIANWPVARIEHWTALLKARAIENQCYVVGVNRVGKDPFNEYNGHSAVFDPMGKESALAGNSETLLEIDLNIEMVNSTREKLPFLNDIKLI